MGTTTSRKSSEAVEGSPTLHDPPARPWVTSRLRPQRSSSESRGGGSVAGGHSLPSPSRQVSDWSQVSSPPPVPRDRLEGPKARTKGTDHLRRPRRSLR